MEISDTTKENSNRERPPGGEAERFVCVECAERHCPALRFSLSFSFHILTFFLLRRSHLSCIVTEGGGSSLVYNKLCVRGDECNGV